MLAHVTENDSNCCRPADGSICNAPMLGRADAVPVDAKAKIAAAIENVANSAIVCLLIGYPYRLCSLMTEKFAARVVTVSAFVFESYRKSYVSPKEALTIFSTHPRFPRTALAA